jgi:hypothetical protein
MKTAKRTPIVLTALIILSVSLPLFAAWTDEKPDSSPVISNNGTCTLFKSGTCHKEQVDSCRCVDCPGLQENFPGCNCVDKTGTAYWQSWDGTCVETRYDDGYPISLFECQWPSEPQNSGDKANQPNCGT